MFIIKSASNNSLRMKCSGHIGKRLFVCGTNPSLLSTHGRNHPLQSLLILSTAQKRNAQISSRERDAMEMGPAVSAPPLIVQDAPPHGGYEPVRYRFKPIKKMWKPETMLVWMIIIMGFGWYGYYKTYARSKVVEQERFLFSEIAINPFLQAEKDIMLTLERRAFRKKVQELYEKDEALQKDPIFNPNAWDHFYLVSKRYAYPFNDTTRYIDKHNVSVLFKGTGLLENEKHYLEQLKQKNKLLEN